MGQPEESAETLRFPFHVLYLHGRPAAHQMHLRLARTIACATEFVDFRLRWQDRTMNVLYCAASWLLCAATLPKKKKYDAFLVDNVHVAPVLMKLLFLKRRQKIVVH